MMKLSMIIITVFLCVLYLCTSLGKGKCHKEDESIEKQEHVDKLISMYEKDVNVTWKALTLDMTKSLYLVPHLDNRHYIISLAEYIAASPTLEVLIVGGPKETTGLVYMADSAWKLGHEVFRLNLKGSNVKEVMSLFADSFVDLIEGITDTNRLVCVYQGLLKCPSIRAAEQETISVTFKAIISTIVWNFNYLYLLTAVALIVLPIFIWNKIWDNFVTFRFWIISLGIGMAAIFLCPIF